MKNKIGLYVISVNKVLPLLNILKTCNSKLTIITEDEMKAQQIKNQLNDEFEISTDLYDIKSFDKIYLIRENNPLNEASEHNVKILKDMCYKNDVKIIESIESFPLENNFCTINNVVIGLFGNPINNDFLNVEYEIAKKLNFNSIKTVVLNLNNVLNDIFNFNTYPQDIFTCNFSEARQKLIDYLNQTTKENDVIIMFIPMEYENIKKYLNFYSILISIMQLDYSIFLVDSGQYSNNPINEIINISEVLFSIKMDDFILSKYGKKQLKNVNETNDEIMVYTIEDYAEIKKNIETIVGRIVLEVDNMDVIFQNIVNKLDTYHCPYEIVI